jgi:hypothetical protein
MLRKVLGPKKEEEEDGGENGIRPISWQPIVTKYYYDDRDLRWAEHVVRMRRRAECEKKNYWGNLEGRDSLKT